MTKQATRDISETHVDTGEEIVIYDEDNTSAHVQSNAYLSLTDCQ